MNSNERRASQALVFFILVVGAIAMQPAAAQQPNADLTSLGYQRGTVGTCEDADDDDDWLRQGWISERAIACVAQSPGLTDFELDFQMQLTQMGGQESESTSGYNARLEILDTSLANLTIVEGGRLYDIQIASLQPDRYSVEALAVEVLQLIASDPTTDEPAGADEHSIDFTELGYEADAGNCPELDDDWLRQAWVSDRAAICFAQSPVLSDFELDFQLQMTRMGGRIVDSTAGYNARLEIIEEDTDAPVAVLTIVERGRIHELLIISRQPDRAGLEDMALELLRFIAGEPAAAAPASDAAAEATDIGEWDALLTPPPGFVPVGEPRVDVSLLDLDELPSGRVTDVLALESTSAFQLLEGPTGVVHAVIVTMHRYELIAAGAAGLELSGRRVDLPEGLAREGLRGWRDASSASATFRSGDVHYLVSTIVGSDADQAELFTLASGLYDGAPAGDRDVFTFATTFQALRGASLFYLAAVLGVGAVRRAQSGPRTAGANARGTSDIDREASRLRKLSRWVTGTQVVAVAAVVVGWTVLGPVEAAVLSLLSVALAVVVSRRIRRMSNTGGFVPAHTSLAGAFVWATSVLLLAVSSAVGARALRDWFFTPSIDHVELAANVGVAPIRFAQFLTAFGLIGVLIGVALVRLARRLSQASATRSAELDARSPVLLLRSFADDRLTVPSVLAARRPVLEAASLRGRSRLEECLAWQLSSLGPVLALADPDGPQKELGAARDQVAHDSWKPLVLDLMTEAQAIVFIVGDSPSYGWELEQAARSGSLAKCLFVVPPVPADDVQRRLSFTADRLELSVGASHENAIVGRVEDGQLELLRSERHDEAAYAAAIRLAAVNTGPHVPTDSEPHRR